MASCRVWVRKSVCVPTSLFQTLFCSRLGVVEEGSESVDKERKEESDGEGEDRVE